jgi:hypothetical protein
MGLFDLFSSNQVPALLQKISSLNTEIAQLKEQANKTQQVLAEKDKLNEKAKLEKQKAIEELKEERAKSSRNGQAKVAQDEKVQSLQAQLSQLEASFKETRAKSYKEEEKIGLLEDELAETKATLEQYRKQLEALNIVVATKDKEAKDKENVKTVREPSLIDLKIKVDNLDSQKDKLAEENRLLKSRVERLELDRAKFQEEKAKAAVISDSTIRDLQHRLDLEKKAYTILSLEKELLVDRALGAEQQVQMRAKEAAENAAYKTEKELRASMSADLEKAKAEATSAKAELNTYKRLVEELKSLKPVARLVTAEETVVVVAEEPAIVEPVAVPEEPVVVVAEEPVVVVAEEPVVVVAEEPVVVVAEEPVVVVAEEPVVVVAEEPVANEESETHTTDPMKAVAPEEEEDQSN